MTEPGGKGSNMMDRSHTSPPLILELETSPDPTIIKAIAEGLDAYNARFAPAADWSPHWVIGRDPAGAVQAGIKYLLTFDWLFVQWLWVAEPYRGRGSVRSLLLGAEAAAKEKDCRGAYLDTFTFQAPKFYERHGYREFGRLNDFPPGQARIFVSKAL
jgi:GNAT superfamily N-acetyltransferase